MIKRCKLQFGLQTEKLSLYNNFKWKVVIKYFDKPYYFAMANGDL